ncbi:IS5 family transposase [Streptomyces sp. NBC_01022]|uniref:IS5 family transposase n=1 Tax=Streptomyces sp. NBC_01022 TaxID=2903723 RepID=UPI002DDAD210|nr:IS5 family transposase [Streptomyces sp. NBC_01022]WRZ78767.1 IS5 family transposase [Streptomyces sp. NBC_01022]WRZ86912.1 IS5 family transposase [Streptomyces sp. NBC_01022]
MSERKPYPSDLSDARWALIEPTWMAWRQARLDRRPTGKPAKVELRDVFNAILYINRTGIPWKYLPHDFPNHGTVYAYYAAWRDEEIFTQLNYDLVGLARVKEGRKPEPTASVIDTQSIKTSSNVPLTSQGTDAAKKIVGRKRGILTDTIGLLLAVTVTAASLSENAVGIRLLDHASRTYPTISKSWVDTGFKNAVIEHGANLGIDVEVVNRNPGIRGFHVVKRRWVVERSIGWIMTHRRLARDYETLPASSKAMIQIASIDNLARRITDETTPTWRGTY